jgi:integrase
MGTILGTPEKGYRMSTLIPPYCRQRETDRPDCAFVRIDGKKIFLGRHGSPESKAKYAEVLAGAKAAATMVAYAPSTAPTVSELILAYLEFAAGYYRKPDGTQTREYEHIVEALKYLRRLAGEIIAREFGPKMLKTVRQELIDKGLSRVHINAQIRRIVGMFRWAVEEETIPETTHRALAAVRYLKRGRSKAKETAPVQPVDMATVEATLEFMPEVVADMVRVQLLTGMRPGEVCILRPCDIDRSGDAWLFTPPQHKTTYRGHRRTIAIGPRAQGILLRYLARSADAYCFQPRDSEMKRLAEREAARITPMNCGNRRGINRNGTSRAGKVYPVRSYRRAVERAAERAGVEHWTPQRLRHTKATDIRKDFGLDAAQAVLGHRGAKVTEVYAELDTAKAVQVALKIG